MKRKTHKYEVGEEFVHLTKSGMTYRISKKLINDIWRAREQKSEYTYLGMVTIDGEYPAPGQETVYREKTLDQYWITKREYRDNKLKDLGI